MRDCVFSSSMVVGDGAEGGSLCKLRDTLRSTPCFRLCLVLGSLAMFPTTTPRFVVMSAASRKTSRSVVWKQCRRVASDSCG